MFARLIRKLLSPRGPLPQPIGTAPAALWGGAVPCQIVVGRRAGQVVLWLVGLRKVAVLSEDTALALARELRAAVLDGRELGDLFRRLMQEAGEQAGAG